MVFQANLWVGQTKLSSGIINKSHRKFNNNPFPNYLPSSDVTPLHQSSVVVQHRTAVMPTVRTYGLGQVARDTIWVVILAPGPRTYWSARELRVDVTTNAERNFLRGLQRGKRFLHEHEHTAEVFKGLVGLLMDVWARNLKRWRNHAD